MNQSQRSVRFRTGLIIIPIILLLAFVVWWQSEWRQIYQIKLELVRLSSKVNTAEALSETAIAFAEIGDFEKANQFAEKLPNEFNSNTLSHIASVAAELGDTTNAMAFLEKALESAQKATTHDDLAFLHIAQEVVEIAETQMYESSLEQACRIAEMIHGDDAKVSALLGIVAVAAKRAETRNDVSFLQQISQIGEIMPNKYNKASILLDLAVSASTMGKTITAISFLEQADQVVEAMPDASAKAYLLTDIANSAAKIGTTNRAVSFLEQAHKWAEKISSDYTKVDCLSKLGVSAAEMGETTKALTFLEQAHHCIETSTQIKEHMSSALAVAIGKIPKASNDISFLQDVFQIAEKIPDDSWKTYALLTFAIHISEKDETKEKDRVLFLEKAVQNIETVSDDNSLKASAFSDLAVSAARIGMIPKALTFLEQARQYALKLPNDKKFDALEHIVGNVAKMVEITKDLSFLELAHQISDEVPNSEVKANILAKLASTAANINENSKAALFVEQAHQCAKGLPDDKKSLPLSNIVVVAAKMGNWQQARDITEANVTDADKAWALAAILKVWAQRQNPALAEETKIE